MINRYLNLSWFSRWSLPRCQTSFNSGPCEFAKFQKTPRMRRLLHIWWIGLWPMSFPRWQNFDILSHFPAELHTRKKLIFGYPSNIMDFLERKWHFPRSKIFGMHATCLGCMKVSRVKWMWFSSLPRVKTYGLQIVSAARKLNDGWLDDLKGIFMGQGDKVSRLKKKSQQKPWKNFVLQGGTHIFFPGEEQNYHLQEFLGRIRGYVWSIGVFAAVPVNLWGLHCLHKNRPARGFSRWHKSLHKMKTGDTLIP